MAMLQTRIILLTSCGKNSNECNSEECQINYGDGSFNELHLYLQMVSDDENETPNTSAPVTLKASSNELTEKCEVSLFHDIVPDVMSSKNAENICDELYVFLDTETLQICEKRRNFANCCNEQQVDQNDVQSICIPRK